MPLNTAPKQDGQAVMLKTEWQNSQLAESSPTLAPQLGQFNDFFGSFDNGSIMSVPPHLASFLLFLIYFYQYIPSWKQDK